MRGNARRRVPGLRREEVAMLADVSVDYYVRLEQGRETGPSAQVLDSSPMPWPWTTTGALTSTAWAVWLRARAPIWPANGWTRICCS